MIRHNLKQIELTNGDRFWVLVDEDGIPDFQASRFLAYRYQKGDASNTLRNIASAVRMLRIFESERGISLEDRVRKGRILSLGEIGKLVEYCGRKLEPRNCQSENNTIIPITKQKQVKDKKTNSRSTQGKRSYYAGRFIEFLINEVVDGPYLNLNEKIFLRSEQKIFASRLNEFIPKQIKPGFNPQRTLTQEAVSKILLVTKGKNSKLAEILFKHPESRKRNYLIIELFLATGARVSEIAGLLRKDVVDEKSTILIQRHSIETRADKRAARPGFKTRERPIQINQDLMRRLSEYITDRKGGRPRNARHEFVFCAGGPKASPLSLSSFYRIICQLKLCFGADWNKRITPHVLRHTFFDIWFREANSKYDFKNNPHLFDQVISAAEMTGGWCPDSEMVNYYKQLYIAEQANEITLGTQKRMLSGNKDQDGA